jgi:diaminopimelate epimerase
VDETTSGYRFVKGHGTGNDFVLLPDPDGSVHGELDAEEVAALCDRRTGIGADGVIRVVRCEGSDDPSAVSARGDAEWFMDYRNHDGSLAQMCGNGVRVLARYLAEHQDASTSVPLRVATRGGVKVATFEDDGTVTVDMGAPEVLADTKVAVGDRSWPATGVGMGNPHAVAFVDSLDEPGTLTRSPAYDAKAYPDGVNVEFVVRRGTGHLAMRVHERGSGETRSCGTGACAAMVAAALADGVPANGPGEPVGYRVDVPGGELRVVWGADGHLSLTGPAVLVAYGTVPKPLASRG